MLPRNLLFKKKLTTYEKGKTRGVTPAESYFKQCQEFSLREFGFQYMLNCILLILHMNILGLGLVLESKWNLWPKFKEHFHHLEFTKMDGSEEKSNM